MESFTNNPTVGSETAIAQMIHFGSDSPGSPGRQGPLGTGGTQADRTRERLERGGVCHLLARLPWLARQGVGPALDGT